MCCLQCDCSTLFRKGPCTADSHCTAAKLGGHGRVHVCQGGTKFEFTTVVFSRSQIDSLMSPKEGKWHQLRRKRR
jgi:hypothetical protein